MVTPDPLPDDLLASADSDVPPEVEGGRIVGAVTDPQGHPLVGVRVEAVASGGADLDLLPALTDGEGRFVLEGLAEGVYDLRFVLGRVRGRTLRVPAGTEDLKVRLARPQGILLVVRLPSDEPVPDLLHVLLERESPQGVVREYVGEQRASRMLLWNIRPGRYTATVWGGPWVPVRAPGIEVRQGQPAPLVEVLLAAPGARILGRAEDADGRPIPRPLAVWKAEGHADPRPREARAARGGDDGAFRLEGLPPGRYMVTAGAETGPFGEAEVVLGDSEERELVVRVG